jgi:hypothetical protein
MIEAPDYWAMHQDIIQDCFSKSTVEEIVAALQASHSAWGIAQANKILANPPLASKVRRIVYSRLTFVGVAF